MVGSSWAQAFTGRGRCGLGGALLIEPCHVRTGIRHQVMMCNEFRPIDRDLCLPLEYLKFNRVIRYMAAAICSTPWITDTCSLPVGSSAQVPSCLHDIGSL